jgi:hypothetical protein
MNFGWEPSVGTGAVSVLFIRGMLISKFLSSGKELQAFTHPARRKDQSLAAISGA